MGVCKVVIPYVVEPHNNKEEQQIKDLGVNNELVVEQPQESLLF